MAGTVNFADYYKLGGLNPGPDIIERRKAPFEKLTKELKPQRVLNLVRLFYSVPLSEDADWFRAAFAETDASFTLIDNEREVAILAGCLLASAIDQANVSAILGLLAASLDGQRAPTVLPGVLDLARGALDTNAVSLRSFKLEGKAFTQLPKGKYAEKAEALSTAGDWAKAAELVKMIGDESFEGIRHSLLQSNAVIPPLVNTVEVLQEHVNILWWLIGGYSRALEVPFSTLVAGLAGVMAGFDIARLSVKAIGPVAAPVLIARLLGPSSLEKEASIVDVVESYPRDKFDELDLDELGSVIDICPLFGAFLKSRDVGKAPSWLGSYTFAAKLDPATKFSAAALARQAYVETLLLKLLA